MSNNVGPADNAGRKPLLLHAAVLTVALLSACAPPEESPADGHPDSAAPSARPTESASGRGSLDENEVMTDAGVVSFGLDGDTIVVRLSHDGNEEELGRPPVRFVEGSPGPDWL